MRVEEDGTVTVGITDYAQQQLGDIVYVELPEVADDPVNKDEPFAVVESVKAVSDVYAPITGKVKEVNDELPHSPEAMNQEPYGDGWMVIMELEQEVSDVAPESSGSLTPTIQQRKINSTVAVQSGETVVLGGLIRENNNTSESGVPGLYKLPVLGLLFGRQTDNSRRTELVVLITPRAVQDASGARAVTEEFRDKLEGLRFDSIRSIERQSDNTAQVNLDDGRQAALSDLGDRGIYVDDERHGRVLVFWDAFERLELTAGPTGPTYDDFPPGKSLTGQVTTHDDRVLAGRLPEGALQLAEPLLHRLRRAPRRTASSRTSPPGRRWSSSPA